MAAVDGGSDVYPLAGRNGRLYFCWRWRIVMVVDRLSLGPNPSSAFVLCAGSFDQSNELGTTSSDLNFELGDESLDLNSFRWNGRANFFKSWEGLAGLRALSPAATSRRSRSRTVWSGRGRRPWRAVLKFELGAAA